MMFLIPVSQCFIRMDMVNIGVSVKMLIGVNGIEFCIRS